MSFINIETLSPQELIAAFVLEQKKQGVTLGYQDYQLIESWLVQFDFDAERLLLALSSIFQKYPFGLKEYKNLKWVDKKLG